MTTTTTTTGRVRGWSRLGRLAVMGVVLGITALVVPDSGAAPSEAALVKVKHATGVDVDPEVVWILMVGSDARPGEDMLRSRGDAIQLVGVDTRTGAAAAIGIPRDSWVAIPGVGSDKINSALYYGGPDLMGQAVGNLVGIQPDYVFVTRFAFFIEMVKSIGGIWVDNPVAFSDYYVKPKGFAAGRIKLSGYDALAFSRVRKSLLRGDFDRSANQQRTMRGIQARIHARADQPGFLEQGVLAVLKNMATDLPPTELFRLAQASALIDPAKVTNCVVLGGIGSVGGASVVFPDTGLAQRLGDRARTDATLESCE